MSNYRMIGTADVPDHDDETMVATHPAPVGTYIVYAFKDGGHHKVPVVLWGVLIDGAAVPITISGVWDGTSNRNRFVLHPDGYCSDFDTSWDSLEKAITEIKQYDS